MYNHFQAPELHTYWEAIETKQEYRGHSEHRGLPGWDTYQHFDNFIVRTLSGHYNLPPGRITRDNLEQAKEVLKRIDVILVLEELGRHWPQVQAVFRWSSSHSHGASNN